MTYAMTPGDCIDRVISQHEIDEFSKGLKLQDRNTDNSTEADLVHRILDHTTSNMDVDTHLGNKDVSTTALLEREAVKEIIAETKTKAIERIKIASNKICIREDLAKENMMFSQEYSQVIFGMGNVELFELKTSRIQFPSCLHYVFRGTIFCACGKHIRHDLDMMRRIRAAFGILKALHFRTSVLTSMGYKHGPNLWQAHPHRAKDALRGCSKSKSIFMSIWDR